MDIRPISDETIEKILDSDHATTPEEGIWLAQQFTELQERVREQNKKTAALAKDLQAKTAECDRFRKAYHEVCNARGVAMRRKAKRLARQLVDGGCDLRGATPTPSA